MFSYRVKGLTQLGLTALLLAPTWTNAEPWQISGYADLEWRYFDESPLDNRQQDSFFATGTEIELYKEFNQGRDNLTITPFARVGQHDSERNHIDFREANWLHIAEDWEVRAGLGKVFWGVTESQHLVDIINQTDTLEGADGEDKLGQPMINLTLSRDWGDVSVFWLPYFRERTFAGPQGRLRSHPKIDNNYARYQSGAEEMHQDFALRWSHTLGDLDVAVSHFHGTSREPTLIATTDNSGNAIFAPLYEQIDQTGLELSLVQGDWLWKLESIHRSGQGDSYSAVVGGFEYTLVGIADSAMDLGFLMEYHYDDRKRTATTPLQDDVFLGLRLTLNDAESTEFLAGVIMDNGSSGMISFMEASTRVGDNIKVSLEARRYHNLPSYDPLSALEQDDHILLNVAWYF
ncbi:MAG: hypothetical protein V7677_17435 [Motiliproteus sp.]